MPPRRAAPEFVVVFDLDGTLVDSRQGIIAATRYAIADAAGPTRTDDDIATFVGDGARRLLSGTLGVTGDDSRLDSMLVRYIDYSARHAADQATLMPGVASTLRALSETKLAVCTNKPRVPCERVLEALGLTSIFSIVVAGGDLEHHKPHPEPLQHIASRLGVPTTSLVMVGDGTQDIECGKAVQARTVAVLGGFGAEPALRGAGADVVINDMSGLLAALASFAAKER